MGPGHNNVWYISLDNIDAVGRESASRELHIYYISFVRCLYDGIVQKHNISLSNNRNQLQFWIFQVISQYLKLASQFWHYKL